MQGGTEYDEGRTYISAIDGPGGPIITADHLTRDRPTYKHNVQLLEIQVQVNKPHNISVDDYTVTAW